MSANTVELIGWYGGDKVAALSAWTSTYRDLGPEKEERIPQLLKMLAIEGHHTPFEKQILHFLVRCETASHIHLLKHRIASINGESARYKELKSPTFYVPPDWPMNLKVKLIAYYLDSESLYHELLDQLEEEGFDRKRAKESARFVLPYGNQLNLDVMFNTRSWINFLNLRRDSHAQDEIHQIADKMINLVKNIEGCPFRYTLEAFGIE